MHNDGHLKPKKRSKLRLYFGKKYYTYKRYLSWQDPRYAYTRHKDLKLLPHVISSHQTPLFRKLKDVDMWLQENKVNNLRIAAKAIDGTLIYPGETFSYWKTIGKPSQKKGYKEGMVLSYGKVIHGTGGGLCQLSNLIFWTTLHSPLTVTERHRHSYDVFPDSNRSQPFGSGATCVYNYRDLQIKNDTDDLYQIRLCVTNDHLVGQIRSVKEDYFKYAIKEKNHEIKPTLWGQYIRHNEIYREIYDLEGTLVKREDLFANDALMMYDPLLESPRDHKT